MTSSADRIRKKYLAFAENEAKGVSPIYEGFTRAVAEDEACIEFLANLPEPKQQPNLLLAAVRKHHGLASSPEEFLEWVISDLGQIRATMIERATQTNEANRCATLLPILASLPQPLALLEVGASAGLCLFPDCYNYRYGDRVLTSGDSDAPEFHCEASATTPIPKKLPAVTWRAGLDLNPLDVMDADSMDWLKLLIWPEQENRRLNLDRAVSAVRKQPPQLVRGDLTSDLHSLIARAPGDANPVVFHSAVLAYVRDRDARDRFVDTMTSSRATWISNEYPAVFPDIASKLPFEPPKNKFLLAVNGDPVALTGPHGQSLDWL